DLAGEAAGLGHLEGRTVWGRFGAGYIDGPYTVSGGKIATDYPAVSAKIGLWQAPNFESMPFVKVMQDNTILQRPGRVHTVAVAMMDTESLAVGANGSAPKNVPLQRASDDLSAAPVPFTGSREISGIMGAVVGPTVRITQLRPGRLRIRDYLVGVKL
ncbi:MAG TPA: hypothetical protein VFQ52_02045, partial [Rhizomicrobium sp.]|nr:hypothetical protein [Rhizomicrobium sp.]